MDKFSKLANLFPITDLFKHTFLHTKSIVHCGHYYAHHHDEDYANVCICTSFCTLPERDCKPALSMRGKVQRRKV